MLELWQDRFQVLVRKGWTNDEQIEHFFNDLKELQRKIQGTEKLPDLPKPQVKYPTGQKGRSIFILRDKKIGPVCLPPKTGTSNWQKALGAVMLRELDPTVMIDSADVKARVLNFAQFQSKHSYKQIKIPHSRPYINRESRSGIKVSLI